MTMNNSQYDADEDNEDDDNTKSSNVFIQISQYNNMLLTILNVNGFGHFPQGTISTHVD